MNTPIKNSPILKWAKEDRPREKLLTNGVESLSNVELIALLLGSGNKDESAIDLARRILISSQQDLNTIAKWAESEFTSFKGVGVAKYTTLKAALELGNRRKVQKQEQRTSYRCSRDIFNLFHPILRDAVQEEFWILLLNQACRIIKHIRISTGGIDGTYADVRSILREALIHRATQMALIHNHPSGNTSPSTSDKNLTYKIRESSSIMNITLVDHLIITENGYFSFADKHLL